MPIQPCLPIAKFDHSWACHRLITHIYPVLSAFGPHRMFKHPGSYHGKMPTQHCHNIFNLATICIALTHRVPLNVLLRKIAWKKSIFPTRLSAPVLLSLVLKTAGHAGTVGRTLATCLSLTSHHSFLPPSLSPPLPVLKITGQTTGKK